MSIAAKITKINTAMDEAVTAQEAGDYATARIKAETAYTLITGLPQKVELENESLEWSAHGIRELLDHFTKRMSAGSGTVDETDETHPGGILRTVPVYYTRESR